MRRGLPEAVERAPNLAPMVDVIMVILVFFMLGASLQLAREGVLRTELDPRSGPGEGAAIEIIPTVKIALEEVAGGEACNIHVMGRPLPGNSFAELRAFLSRRRAAGADPDSPVVIAAQPAVRWRLVVQALDAALEAGFRNPQFAVRLGGGTRLPGDVEGSVKS
ncbi:MAG: biopolymer transporter ExbD, partial [Planctomycetota bacterium]